MGDRRRAGSYNSLLCSSLYGPSIASIAIPLGRLQVMPEIEAAQEVAEGADDVSWELLKANGLASCVSMHHCIVDFNPSEVVAATVLLVAGSPYKLKSSSNKFAASTHHAGISSSTNDVFLQKMPMGQGLFSVSPNRLWWHQVRLFVCLFVFLCQ